MSLASYPDLQTTIAAYAFRVGDGEFTAMVPTFIRLAESRFNKKMRLREMEATAVIALDESGTGDLPEDYLSYREARIDPNRRLEAVDLSFGRDHLLGDAASYFAVTGSQIRTFPAYEGDLRLSYYAKVPPLSQANPTNWLLEKAPDVYLYGALLESQPFTMDDARMATWGTLFEQALTDLAASDDLAKYARAAVRTRGPTP